MIVAESESDIRITRDTPYLTLISKLWGIYCEDLGENWLHYNGTTLYHESWLLWKKKIFDTIKFFK